MKSLKQLGIFLFGISTLTVTLEAQPVLETFDRFELNWSVMKIHFYGEATVEQNQKSFSEAEKSAADDALLYAATAITNIRSEKGLGSGPKSLSNDLTKQANLVGTNYFADGRVRAEFESSLIRALESGSKDFKSDEPQAAQDSASSIVVTVKGLRGPRMISAVYDEDGQILHGLKDVSRSGFRKNGLGRWFYRNSAEANAYTGASPVTIEGVYSSGKLTVKKEDWEKVKGEHQRLLEESKVAYLLFGSGKATAKSSEKPAL